MILDSRIKRLFSGAFRITLSVDDILDIKDSDVITIKDGDIIEKAVLFVDNPIVFPYIHYYNLYKIFEDERGELVDVILSYLFLNPNIGNSGLSKMANFISTYHLNYIYDEPSFDADYVLKLCKSMNQEYISGDIPIVESHKTILYQNFSELSSDVKKENSNKARTSHLQGLWDNIIHASAIHAIANTERFKIISKPIIMESSKTLVNNGELSKEIKSYSMYDLYVKDRTKKLLIKDGKHRHIYSRSFDKWLRFLELDNELTLREISKELKVSNSTAIEFKGLKDKYEINND